MTATSCTTIARAGQCVAAIILLAGLAVGPPATARAEDREWNIDMFDKCMAVPGNGEYYCCLISDGDWDDNRDRCVAPPALQAPQGPGPSNTSPTRRGPNSGTAAP
ncbi:MAG: hypothetical protein WAM92_01730 [Mycobacterium sp.]